LDGRWHKTPSSALSIDLILCRHEMAIATSRSSLDFPILRVGMRVTGPALQKRFRPQWARAESSSASSCS
jgi:hypothetical protein